MVEVLIVGGGPAGLSAALVLGRCRRRVLLCDAGSPRNAATPAMHGFLSRDGLPPAELRRLGREQLRPYDTVTLRDVAVVDARPTPEGFVATLADGTLVTTRKLLLATGIVDELPPQPGFRALYGVSVWHCPYCDGWELRDRPLAVYGRGARAVGEARALTRYASDLVVCTDGETLSPDDAAAVGRTGATVRPEPILRLEPRPDGLEVVFGVGPPLPRAALFFCTPVHVRSPLAERLGCRLADGGLVETNASEGTGVRGLWVAGDASRSVLLAIVAAGEGANAAFAINRELLREDLG